MCYEGYTYFHVLQKSMSDFDTGQKGCLATNDDIDLMDMGNGIATTVSEARNQETAKKSRFIGMVATSYTSRSKRKNLKYKFLSQQSLH